MASSAWLITYTSELLDIIDPNNPQLIPGVCRSILINELERLLVRERLLLHYVKAVASLLSKDKSFDYSELRQHKKDILEKGISALKDKHIAVLLYDITFLIQLSTAIERQPSATWIEVLDRENLPYFGKKSKKIIQ